VPTVAVLGLMELLGEIAVHLCVTDSQLAEANKKHWCVAVPDQAKGVQEAGKPGVCEDIEVSQVGGIEPDWNPLDDQ
jgi:hypothetical protein